MKIIWGIEMYFWNIHGIKSEITRGEFTDRRIFPYILLYVGVVSVFLELCSYFPYEGPNYWDYIQSVLNILIAVAGTIYAYHANGGGEGQHFAGKFFGIGFVVLIRFLVFALPIMAGLVVYWFYAFGEDETIQTTPLDLVVISAWSVAVYVRTAKHMRDTAEAQRAKP